jgi:hypothetical protein
MLGDSALASAKSSIVGFGSSGILIKAVAKIALQEATSEVNA